MTLTRRHALQRMGAAGMSLLLPACGPHPAPSDSNVRKAGAADGALRLELRHHVSHGTEGYALARVRAESRWAGPKRRGNDRPDWGDYRLSVFEAGTKTLVYRTGFDSNLDLQGPSTATQLSVRFPAPVNAVRATIEKRRAASVFSELWNIDIDPAGGNIDRSAPALPAQVHAILANGDPQTKVDIAILGDGYQAAEHRKFIADAKRAAGYLFSVDPFRARMHDFNVSAVFTPSADSGVTDRYLGVEKNTVLRCAYGGGNSERTLAPGDEHALREAACAVPYDFLLILANARRYGGSAYFGGPATIAIDSAAARYLVVHEFAHIIGGLADEYYLPTRSGPTYTGNIEPWNPNVTLSSAHAKWTMTDTRPARWNKAEYDRGFADYVRRYFALRDARADEAAVEQLMQAEAGRQAALLAKNRDRRTVGLFEGAHGYAKGVFRSEVDCIMFSLQTDYFCGACLTAISSMIDAQCDRIA